MYIIFDMVQYILYFCRLFQDVQTRFGHIGNGPALLDGGFPPKEGRFPYVGGQSLPPARPSDG